MMFSSVQMGSAHKHFIFILYSYDDTLLFSIFYSSQCYHCMEAKSYVTTYVVSYILLLPSGI